MMLEMILVGAVVGGVTAFAGWRMFSRSSTDRSQGFALRAGARDARRNIPSAATGNPWPTPAMRKIVKRYRQSLAEMGGDYASRLAYARSNHDVAELHVEELRKRHASGQPIEPRLEAAERALMVGGRALGDVSDRLASAQEAKKHDTEAVLEEYRRANIAARRSEDRLLLDQLPVPDLDDPAWAS